jgi:hypothetical protein
VLALFALGVSLYTLLSINPSASAKLWLIKEVASLEKPWIRSQTDMIPGCAQTAVNLNREADAHALRWTLNPLDNDHGLEEGFLHEFPSIHYEFTNQASQQSRSIQLRLNSLLSPFPRSYLILPLTRLAVTLMRFGTGGTRWQTTAGITLCRGMGNDGDHNDGFEPFHRVCPLQVPDCVQSQCNN